MNRTEYRFVTFRQPAERLVPDQDGGVTSLTVDFLGSVPELADYMDGWEVVSFQITPFETSVLLTVLLRTQLTIPQVD